MKDNRAPCAAEERWKRTEHQHATKIECQLEHQNRAIEVLLPSNTRQDGAGESDGSGRIGEDRATPRTTKSSSNTEPTSADRREGAM